MSIREIFCQERAVAGLQRALAAERLAHAYIFEGPEGVGKSSTAREWSKLLLCSDRRCETDENGRLFYDSCGRCASCRAFENQVHPDFNLVYKELLEFTRDGKTRNPPRQLTIDVVREFLIEKVAVTGDFCACGCVTS